MTKNTKNNNANLVSILLIPVVFALLAVAFTSGLYFAQQAQILNDNNEIEEVEEVEEVVEEIEKGTVLVNDLRFGVEIPVGWSIENMVTGDLPGWTFGGSEGYMEFIYAEAIDGLALDEELLMSPRREQSFILGANEILVRIYHGDEASEEFLSDVEMILNSVNRQP